MKTKYKYTLPKKNYFQYLALLCLSLVLFTAYALRPDDIDISMVLKKRHLTVPNSPAISEKPKLAARRQNSQISPTAPASLGALDEASVAHSPTDMLYSSCYVPYPVQGAVDTTRQRFLLIGDSMGEYLRLRLNDYCNKNGHTMESVIWYSSSTEYFGTCDTLTHFIETYKPTYILLTLGSNELFIKNIKEKREDYVKHILAEVGNIPYIWIGPPNWKEDTGINDLIVENVGAGHYFESKKLSYERGSDHAHPVKSSAYKWMDSIAYYLYNDAAHRVVMEYPDKSVSKIPHTVILSPKRN